MVTKPVVEVVEESHQTLKVHVPRGLNLVLDRNLEIVQGVARGPGRDQGRAHNHGHNRVRVRVHVQDRVRDRAPDPEVDHDPEVVLRLDQGRVRQRAVHVRDQDLDRGQGPERVDRGQDLAVGHRQGQSQVHERADLGQGRAVVPERQRPALDLGLSQDQGQGHEAVHVQGPKDVDPEARVVHDQNPNLFQDPSLDRRAEVGRVQVLDRKADPGVVVPVDQHDPPLRCRGSQSREATLDHIIRVRTVSKTDVQVKTITGTRKKLTVTVKYILFIKINKFTYET